MISVVYESLSLDKKTKHLIAWGETTFRLYERKSEQYQSDLTDAVWELLEPHLTGSRRKWPMRELICLRLKLAQINCK